MLVALAAPFCYGIALNFVRRFAGLDPVVLIAWAMTGGALAIAASGNDMITSFSASATSLGNVGPGLGALDHGGDFRALHPFGRVVAIAQMLLGRLEIYPVILALSVVTLRFPNTLRRLRHRL